MQAAPSAVWAVVRDIANYPRYMADVRSVVLTGPAEAARSTSAWSVSLRGSVLEWTEDDVFDDEKMRIDFRQTSGDLDRFVGFWQITPLADDESACEVVFYADFDIGIPLLADMLNPIAQSSLRANASRMLETVEELATRATSSR